MTVKKTDDEKTTGLLVERDRLHYANARGNPRHVRIEEPMAIDLELPTSYARDLLTELKRRIAETDELDCALLSIDLPVRVYLRPMQVEQLVARLEEIVL